MVFLALRQGLSCRAKVGAPILRQTLRGVKTMTMPVAQSSKKPLLFGATLLGGFLSFYTYNQVAHAKDDKPDMKYKHVIIGAGVAARACLATLNEEDKSGVSPNYDGLVLMIGNDSRMNSIGYTDKDRKELSAPTNNPSNNLLLGHYATKLDVQKKLITLHDGTVVSFDKCFLATGGIYPEMKNVEANAAKNVTTFRKVSDLDACIDAHYKHVTVVGGGTLGTEIALALKAKAGDSLEVTQVYAEPGTMHRNLPDYFRAYCTALLRSKGIEQRNFSLVSKIEKNASTDRINVVVDSWEQYTMATDHVIFAPTHIDANTELADEAGLEIDTSNSGIVVNSELQAFSDIYVGGDAASYPSPYLGRRRDQNYDHAYQSGKLAGQNMVGQRRSYDHVSVAEIAVKSINMKHVMVGNADARLETIGFWEMQKTKKRGKTDDQYFFTSKYNKGVVFYLDSGRVVGVLLTNIEDKEDIARSQELIKDRIIYSDLQRPDLENELREKVGFELQVPMVRSTFGKGASTKKEQKQNPYKRKRHVSASLARHQSDVVRDANTNLYWKSN